MPCLLSFSHSSLSFVFFFFQAEDGIRDYKVTGVQTCVFRSPLMRFLPAEAPARERPVSGPSYLIDLCLEVWEDCKRLFPPASNSGMASVRVAPLDPNLIRGDRKSVV